MAFSECTRVSRTASSLTTSVTLEISGPTTRSRSLSRPFPSTFASQTISPIPLKCVCDLYSQHCSFSSAHDIVLMSVFDAQINVWFTGHSLGCATASLVYSRFLMRHKEMGKKSELRDAYLFAAPILCDPKSVEGVQFSFRGFIGSSLTIVRTLVFNAKMAEDRKRPKVG